jgi:hypothetical protein
MNNTTENNTNTIDTNTIDTNTKQRKFVDFNKCVELVSDKKTTQPTTQQTTQQTTQPETQPETQPTKKQETLKPISRLQVKMTSTSIIQVLREKEQKKRTEKQEENKEKMLETDDTITYENTHTKACYNISRNEDGSWNYCEREYCTFAHSLEEYKDLICTWDMECKNPLCGFRHTCETREQYYGRVKKTIPVLPPTREPTSTFYWSCNDTNKPRVKIDLNPEQTQESPVAEQQIQAESPIKEEYHQQENPTTEYEYYQQEEYKRKMFEDFRKNIGSLFEICNRHTQAMDRLGTTTMYDLEHVIPSTIIPYNARNHGYIHNHIIFQLDELIYQIKRHRDDNELFL